MKANQSKGFLITQVGLKPDNWKPIKDIGTSNNTISISGIKHESALLRLDYLKWEEWLNLPILLYLFLSFIEKITVILILLKLIHIFRHLKERRVFVPSNVNCICHIGFCLLSIPLIKLLSGITIKPYLMNQVKTIGYQIMQRSVIWNVEYQWLITGLLVLLLAQIFSEGVQLQQEKDLTI
jgi:hypothetical protein